MEEILIIDTVDPDSVGYALSEIEGVKGWFPLYCGPESEVVAKVDIEPQRNWLETFERLCKIRGEIGKIPTVRYVRDIGLSLLHYSSFSEKPKEETHKSV